MYYLSYLDCENVQHLLLVLKWVVILFICKYGKIHPSISLREKCRYSELFWSVFSRIWTEYGEILRIAPYSVPMRENTDQNNSE